MTISKMAEEIVQAGATILVDSCHVSVSIEIDRQFDGVLYRDALVYRQHNGNIIQAIEAVVIEAHPRLEEIRNIANGD